MRPNHFAKEVLILGWGSWGEYSWFRAASMTALFAAQVSRPLHSRPISGIQDHWLQQFGMLRPTTEARFWRYRLCRSGSIHGCFSAGAVPETCVENIGCHVGGAKLGTAEKLVPSSRSRAASKHPPKLQPTRGLPCSCWPRWTCIIVTCCDIMANHTYRPRHMPPPHAV